MSDNEPSTILRKPTLLEWLLRLACATMLVGHGWMCWNGQLPLRALLWDEELIASAVKSLTGMEWGAWVSSMEVDANINRAIRIQAWVFFAFAAATLLPFQLRFFRLLHLLAAFNLALLAGLKYHDSGMGVAQFFEHASQFLLPLVLFVVVRKDGWSPVSVALAKLSLAATFIGHGLFAFDAPSQTSWLNHPRPGGFTEMTMLCLKIETEAVAEKLLFGAAIADFIAAVLIFFPNWRWPQLLGLVYMIVWGFLTALARPWAYYEPTEAADSLMRWIPEFLYRAPHFALPLCLLLALRRRKAEV